MCAIVDANVVSEILGKGISPAGEAFRKWVEGRKGKLMTGGELRVELTKSGEYMSWARELGLNGTLQRVNEDELNDQIEKLKREHVCRSNDHHIIALAQVSGARLLFTNDKALTKDFKNKDLIASPRGKVYSTLHNKAFTKKKEEQLRIAVCKGR